MRKLLTVLFAAVVFVLASTGAAAHITVSPQTAAPGSFTKLTFRVPNEDDNAATSKVEVFFPEDAPIAFVSAKPTPGWTHTVAKRTLRTPIEAHGTPVSEVVESITWTGGAIRPGEFQEFEASAGPLPEGKRLLRFRALQTYDNGTVVRWIEPTPASGAEPEHPAPELQLTPVAAERGDHDDDHDDNDALTTGLAAAALVISIAAALLALTRRRSTS